MVDFVKIYRYNPTKDYLTMSNVIALSALKQCNVCHNTTKLHWYQKFEFLLDDKKIGANLELLRAHAGLAYFEASETGIS